MSRIIVGPTSARPEIAPLGTQYWDSENNQISTFRENGWDKPLINSKDTSVEESKVEEIKVEESVEVVMEAPKKIRAKKTSVVNK